MKENKALSSTLQKARGGKDAASKNSIVLLEAERSKREETEKTAQQLRSQNSEQMIKISELQAQLEAARNEAADAARESMDKTHLLQGALAEAQDFQKLSDKLTVQLNDALLSVQHLEAALDSSCPSTELSPPAMPPIIHGVRAAPCVSITTSWTTVSAVCPPLVPGRTVMRTGRKTSWIMVTTFSGARSARDSLFT